MYPCTSRSAVVGPESTPFIALTAATWLGSRHERFRGIPPLARSHPATIAARSGHLERPCDQLGEEPDPLLYWAAVQVEGVLADVFEQESQVVTRDEPRVTLVMSSRPNSTDG